MRHDKLHVILHVLQIGDIKIALDFFLNKSVVAGKKVTAENFRGDKEALLGGHDQTYKHFVLCKIKDRFLFARLYL